LMDNTDFKASNSARTPYSGFSFTLNNCIINWNLSQQNPTASSSTEPECIAQPR